MSDEQSPQKSSRSKRIRLTSGLVGLAGFLLVAAFFSGDGDLQGWATGSQDGDLNFAEQPIRDISWAEKSCCCKAGCPDGSYFCRTMCHLLGGTCTRSASSYNGGNPTLRNACMGATFSWWSGASCPGTCPAHSGVSP